MEPETKPVTVRMRLDLVQAIERLGPLRPTIRKVMAEAVRRPELADVRNYSERAKKPA